MSPAVDWPRVLEDLSYALGPLDHETGFREPANLVAVAAIVKVPRSTIRGWIDGSEPKHSDGERLLDRWCEATGKGRMFVPIAR